MQHRKKYSEIKVSSLQNFETKILGCGTMNEENLQPLYSGALVCLAV